MARWKCPNHAKKDAHPEKILFQEENSDLQSAGTVAFKTPIPAYCDVCERYYTKYECVEV